MKWLIGGLAMLTLCACEGPVHKHRYRLTVEIETPDGIKRGFSVIEAKSRRVSSIDGSGQGTAVSGDAVFVDLGRGRNIVAIMAIGPNADTFRFGHLVPLAFGRQGTEADWLWLESQSGSVSLGPENTPTLVTLEDINDPRSVRLVARDRLEDTFGKGFRFAGASIELTRDAVTRGIREKLPWLTEEIKRGNSGTVDSRPGLLTASVPYFTRN